MKTLQIYALSVGKDCRFNTRILLCLLLRARLLGLNKRKKQKAVFFFLNQKQKHVVYFFFPAGGGMPRFECFSALVEYHCIIMWYLFSFSHLILWFCIDKIHLSIYIRSPYIETIITYIHCCIYKYTLLKNIYIYVHISTLEPINTALLKAGT